MYTQIWDDIKEINIARTMGLHRIVGEISKDLEKGFRKKFNLNDGSLQKIKQAIKPRMVNCQEMRIPILKRTLGQRSDISTKTEKPKKKRVRFKIKDMPDKSCSEVTCNAEHGRGLFHKCKPNRIQSNQKHCLWYSKQCTAIRKSMDILENYTLS